MIGRLVKLLGDKGYGFIRVNGEEFFLHRSDFKGHWDDLVNDFAQGHEISIEFTKDMSNPKGPRASVASRTDYPNQA